MIDILSEDSFDCRWVESKTNTNPTEKQTIVPDLREMAAVCCSCPTSTPSKEPNAGRKICWDTAVKVHMSQPFRSDIDLYMMIP